jgi:hypothetical protein
LITKTSLDNIDVETHEIVLGGTAGIRQEFCGNIWWPLLKMCGKPKRK